MSPLLPFKENQQLTMGVELELQLVDLHHFNLAMESKDLMRRLSEVSYTGEIKPEITQSMIEINSSVHVSYPSLLSELRQLRDVLAEEARQTQHRHLRRRRTPFPKMGRTTLFFLQNVLPAYRNNMVISRNNLGVWTTYSHRVR